MRKAPIVGLALAAVVLAGCSGSTSSTSGGGNGGAPAGAVAGAVAPSGPAGTTPSGGASGPAASGAPGASGSASPTAPPIVVPAKVGDCFFYQTLDHWVLDEKKTVPCSKKHTAQTVYVGTITDPNAISFEQAGLIDAKARKAGGVDKLAPEDKAAWQAYVASLASVTPACDKAIVKATGAKLPNGVLSSSLFTSDLTGPTQAEWDKGHRWVRCNAVARLVPDDFTPNTPLLALPASLKTALTKNDKYRNCWIPLQQNKKVRSVACEGHSASTGAWLTISDQLKTPKSAYPGQKGALAAAKGPCVNLTRHFTPTRGVTARWWVWHVTSDGTPKSGASKATWGTDKSHFGCAMPNFQFGNYR
jgi:hypothetical protein